MPNLPSGKGQLNITGVKKAAIDLFRKLCEKEGRKQGKLFEMMVERWVASTSAKESPKPLKTHKRGVIRFEARVGRTEIERKAEEGNRGK